MFKWYGDITKLNEKDMSGATLMRLRLYVFLSLPVLPLVGLWKLGVIQNGSLQIVCGITLIVSAIALIILMTSRFAYRLWVPDKYLDEWEIRIKHQSMSFGFQVVMYTIAIVVGLFIGSDGLNDAALPKLTSFGIIYGLFAILALGQYAQFFAQLALIQPIEEDELDSLNSERPSMRGAVFAALAIFTIFIVPPFVVGVSKGFNEAHDIAILGKRAKVECEGRGSTVHWVSNKDAKDGNSGFACFDENRTPPENAKLRDPSP